MNTTLLAGKLVFRPGAGDPVLSSRTPLAGRLLRHTPAQMAPARLAALYGLCGYAHRLTAQLAIDAAYGLRGQPMAEELAGLAAETQREHVRRIWLDWPRLVGADDAEAATGARALSNCPALHADGKRAKTQMRPWIEHELLGECAARWLTHWRADPIACLDEWAARGRTMPARLLQSIASTARGLTARALPLLAHAQSSTLSALARSIADQPDFEKLPTWKGQCCETGSWNRLADAEFSQDHEARDAWLRFGARVAEITALTCDAVPRLAAGAMTLAPGEALAWSEMARGLLLHRVRLERGGAESTVADYQVIAPTEWNFHPRGAVSSQLKEMSAATVPEQSGAMERRIDVLAAAFDPCISYHIEHSHA
jgi:hypothetical protein